jgi:hypothetical protein
LCRKAIEAHDRKMKLVTFYDFYTSTVGFRGSVLMKVSLLISVIHAVATHWNPNFTIKAQFFTPFTLFHLPNRVSEPIPSTT